MSKKKRARGILEPYADVLDAEAVMDAIMLKRAEIDESAPAPERDFRVVLRGGAWLFKTKGVEYDSIRAEAASQEVEQWCVMKGLNKSFTASLAGHGDATAMLLCRAWAARMQHLYDVSGDGRVARGAPDVCVFEEDPQVQVCFDSSSQAVRNRISQIRALKLRGQ